MQTNTKQVNIKVEQDGQIRRFSLSELNFPLLEKQLRTLFLAEPTAVLKISFLDDDKDWVTIQTTSELQDAVQLSPILLRLLVELSTTTVPTPEPSQRGRQHCGRGRGRFQGRGIGKGRGRGTQRDSQQLDHTLRLAEKLDRLTLHIGEIEATLSGTDIPESQARTLLWRLLRLKTKVDTVQRKKTALEETSNLAISTPSGTPISEPSMPSAATTPLSPNSSRDDFLAARKAVQHAKKDLWIARKNGNKQEIDEHLELLRQAKEQWEEAKPQRKVGRDGGRARATKAFSPETELLHTNLVQAKQELKEARQLKNREVIQEKWEALQSAKQQWAQVKGCGFPREEVQGL